MACLLIWYDKYDFPANQKVSILKMLQKRLHMAHEVLRVLIKVIPNKDDGSFGLSYDRDFSIVICYKREK